MAFLSALALLHLELPFRDEFLPTELRFSLLYLFRVDGDYRLVIVVSFDDCRYSHFSRLTSSLSNLVEFGNVTLVIFPTSQIIDLT